MLAVRSSNCEFGKAVVLDYEYRSRRGRRGIPPRGLRLPAEDLCCLGTDSCLREILKGRFYLSPTVAKGTVDILLHQDKESTDEGQRLSERQREVLQLLTEGKSMKEAAYILNVTTSTVAFHKLRITKVLNAGSNTDLVQYAVRNHLIVGGSQAEITRPSNVHAKQHGEGQVFA